MKIIFDTIDDLPQPVARQRRTAKEEADVKKVWDALIEKWVSDIPPGALRPAKQLRPWQKFILPYSMVVAGAVSIAPVWGSTWASGGPWYVFAAIALIIWLATAGIILTLAHLRGRL